MRISNYYGIDSDKKKVFENKQNFILKIKRQKTKSSNCYFPLGTLNRAILV